MTPEQRIQQLAAERGGVVVFNGRTAPRRPRPASDKPSAPPERPQGFDVALQGSWRRITDSWENRERIARLQRLEVYLTAGVVCRYLGPEWSRELNPEARGGQCHVSHREGWGFRLGRCWQDDKRFSVSALDQYKRGEPASITVSASRSLAAIAADIERRLVNNGLREAWEQSQSAGRARRNERKARFDQLRATVAAWGGHIDHYRRWEREGYPTASIPGGSARTDYSGRIEIVLHLTAAEAVRIGELTRKAKP